MKADLTRNTFNPLKHFSRVLMQQGRVQLDADWNEQTAILLHYLRTLAADLIGPYGGGPGNGFLISQASPPSGDFLINPGHYYVDGILCELEGDTISYLSQPDLPVPGTLTNGSTYLVYLDVWERHITYLENDDSNGPGIREVALGGPDTATRAKVVWQVKVTDKGPDGKTVPTSGEPSLQKMIESTWSTWVAQWQPTNRGMLKAQVQPAPASSDPCTMSPDARYRGAENQLYRVEIHQGSMAGDGSSSPTFKWSRENGSVVFPILQLPPSDPGTTPATTIVTLANLGRDDRFGLAEGDWVEIVDDDYVLQQRAENLLRIQAIDRTTMTVTLTGTRTSGSVAGTDPTKHPLLRRWDQQAGDSDDDNVAIGNDGTVGLVETSATNDAWLDLEDGVQIQFQAGATYRTGDYWLIPARVATGNVEWPIAVDDQANAGPAALPPHGVEHHYAPLAVITVDGNGNVTSPTSLRRTLTPVATP